LNKHLEWKIKLGIKDTLSPLDSLDEVTPRTALVAPLEGDQPMVPNENHSILPLFIINKFKIFKRYFIFIFLGFLIFRLMNIRNPIFLQGLFSKILIFIINSYYYLIFLLICWLIYLILQYLLYLYFLNNKNNITNNKFIKYLPNIYYI